MKEQHDEEEKEEEEEEEGEEQGRAYTGTSATMGLVWSCNKPIQKDDFPSWTSMWHSSTTWIVIKFNTT